MLLSGGNRSARWVVWTGSGRCCATRTDRKKWLDIRRWVPNGLWPDDRTWMRDYCARRRRIPGYRRLMVQSATPRSVVPTPSRSAVPRDGAHGCDDECARLGRFVNFAWRAVRGPPRRCSPRRTAGSVLVEFATRPIPSPASGILTSHIVGRHALWKLTSGGVDAHNVDAHRALERVTLARFPDEWRSTARPTPGGFPQITHEKPV